MCGIVKIPNGILLRSFSTLVQGLILGKDLDAVGAGEEISHGLSSPSDEIFEFPTGAQAKFHASGL